MIYVGASGYHHHLGPFVCRLSMLPVVMSPAVMSVEVSTVVEVAQLVLVANKV